MTFRNYITQFVGVIFLMVGLFQLGLGANAAQADTLTVTNNLNVVGFDDSKESLYMCVDDGPAPFGDLGKIEQGETVQLSGDSTTNAENRKFYFVWRADDSNSFNTYCDSLNTINSETFAVADFLLSEVNNSNLEINGELGVAGQPRTYLAARDFGMSFFTPGETKFSLVLGYSVERFNVNGLCIDGIYRVEEQSGTGDISVTPGNHEVYIPTSVVNPGDSCPENNFKLSWFQKLTGALPVQAQVVQNPVTTITAVEGQSIQIFTSNELNSNLNTFDALDDVKVYSDGELIWEFAPAIGGGGSLLRTGGSNQSRAVLYATILGFLVVSYFAIFTKASKK